MIRSAAWLLLLVIWSSLPAQAPGRAAADAAFAAGDWAGAAARYEAIASASPAPDAEVCQRLGYCLHVQGRLDEALPWHERAAARHAENPRVAAVATYNVACVHALRGRTDAAFAALELAVQRGFRREQQLRRDPDLSALRADPRLQRLVAAIEDDRPLVAIVVHEGVETLDFAGPVEVFTSAHDAAGDRAYRVRFVAPRRGPVRPQHWRATMQPDFDITDCPQPAVLVIPGGDTGVLDEDPEFVAWVRRTAPAAELVLSVCTGAFVLAKAGLLDGLEATTYHGARPVLQRQYPAVRVVARKVVDNGRIVTAAGVSSGIDGALHVVQRQHGGQAAQRVADYMEYAWRRQDEAAADRSAGERAAEPLYQRALALAAGNASPAELLAAVAAALRAGACPTRALTEPCFDRLRTERAFREAIRDHARQSDVVLVHDGEPGTALVVDGTVLDAAGRPVAAALVYVWHTDHTGTYGHGGFDEANPRLFGYVRTDDAGRFRFRTVRPTHYATGTDERVEQHMHGVVTPPGGEGQMTRLGFADDPHWARVGREPPAWAVPVTVDAAGRERCTWTIRLR